MLLRRTIFGTISQTDERTINAHAFTHDTALDLRFRSGQGTGASVCGGDRTHSRALGRVQVGRRGAATSDQELWPSGTSVLLARPRAERGRLTPAVPALRYGRRVRQSRNGGSRRLGALCWCGCRA